MSRVLFLLLFGALVVCGVQLYRSLGADPCSPNDVACQQERILGLYRLFQ
jgi:hypothetical protein